MTSKLCVGTSGYSFSDWVGTVYPPALNKQQFLSYYSSLFDSVEINTTYYRTPSPEMFVAMLRKVSSDFTFVVKMPREITHIRDKADRVFRPFLRSLAPLIDADQIGGLLAQFPYSFKRSENTQQYLAHIREMFSDCSVPINVEFRHISWYEQDVYDYLRRLGVGFVNVDLPNLPNLPRPSNIVTTSTAYYRLHGRNQVTWWQHSTPSKRYDYLYSEQELDGWARKIQQRLDDTNKAFIFANNCHLGQSVVNALHLHQRLGLSQPAFPSELAPELFSSRATDLVNEIKDRISLIRDEKANRL